jgi:hypothetical protein
MFLPTRMWHESAYACRSPSLYPSDLIHHRSPCGLLSEGGTYRHYHPHGHRDAKCTGPPDRASVPDGDDGHGDEPVVVLVWRRRPHNRLGRMPPMMDVLLRHLPPSAGTTMPLLASMPPLCTCIAGPVVHTPAAPCPSQEGR